MAFSFSNDSLKNKEMDSIFSLSQIVLSLVAAKCSLFVILQEVVKQPTINQYKKGSVWHKSTIVKPFSCLSNKVFYMWYLIISILAVIIITIAKLIFVPVTLLVACYSQILQWVLKYGSSEPTNSIIFFAKERTKTS